MPFGLPSAERSSIWVPIARRRRWCSPPARTATPRAARWLALVGAIAGLPRHAPALYAQFDAGAHGFQFVELTPWIERFNVNYHLGIDGISLLLILLNSFTTVLVVIAGWEVIEKRVAQYMAAFLILSGLHERRVLRARRGCCSTCSSRRR